MGEQITTANVVGLFAAIASLVLLLGIHDAQHWNMRLPLYLVVIVWTILRPRTALYLLPLAVPWGALDTFTLGSTNLGGYDADILVGLLATGWLLSFTLRPFVAYDRRESGPLDREAITPPRALVVAMLVLLFTMIISVTVAFSISSSLKEIVKWFEVLVILLLGTQYIRTRRQIWTIVVIMCLAGISQALLGFEQEFLNLGPTNFVRDATLRVYGTFAQPNPYAGYINMTLALALALMLLGRNWRTRILAACTVIPLAIVVYYTQSKGGWIAIGVAALFIVTAGFPRLRPLMLLAFIAFLTVIGAYLAGKIPAHLIDPILTRIGLINISFTAPTPDNYANSERVAHWVAGINMFADHPFLGVGIGNYSDLYRHYQLGIFVIPLGHAHNYYINIAAEAGLFGLTAFLLLLTTIFVAGGRTLRVINGQYRSLKARLAKPQGNVATAEVQTRLSRFGILVNDRALAIGLLASLISVCMHNLVDNVYVHSMTNLFALLIVLLIRLDRVT